MRNVQSLSSSFVFGFVIFQEEKKKYRRNVSDEKIRIYDESTKWILLFGIFKFFFYFPPSFSKIISSNRLFCAVCAVHPLICCLLSIFVALQKFHCIAQCIHCMLRPATWRTKNINEEILNLFAYDISRGCVLFIYTLLNCVPLNNGLIF